MTPTRAQVAAAMAFFESTDDIALLHQLTAEVAPRARRAVTQLLASGGDATIPAPADLRPARAPAARADAVATLRSVDDFALLQALARTIGRRIEAIEIVASAALPEGARVRVPGKPTFSAGEALVQGTVEATGTSLRVLLDNGETWEGPPSLARRVAAS